MNCKKCGNIITENDKFCPSCGQPVEAAPVAETPVEPTPVASEPVATPTPAPVESAPVAETPTPAPVTPTPIITEPIVNQMPENVSTKKKGGAGFIILVIILGLIILGLGVFIAIKMLGGNKDNGTTNNTSSNTGNTEVVDNNTNSGSNTGNNTTPSTTPTPTTTTTGTTVELGDYVVTLPSGFNDDAGDIYTNGVVTFTIDAEYVSFDEAVTLYIPEFVEKLKNSGEYTIKTNEKMVIGGRSYYIIEIASGEYSLDTYFTELDDYSTAWGTLYMTTGTRTSAYNYINQTLSSKKTSGSSTFANSEVNFDIKDIDFSITKKNN